MNDRRKISYKKHGKPATGYCLLITGGIMSPPEAVVERQDGTVTEIPIGDIQFIDTPQWEDMKKW